MFLSAAIFNTSVLQNVMFLLAQHLMKYLSSFVLMQVLTYRVSERESGMCECEKERVVTPSIMKLKSLLMFDVFFGSFASVHVDVTH